jgi:sn-glycerol 3-phosphate transport system substrate-binding protein
VTEVSFLNPVAVGGPITKVIDGYARAFEVKNPEIRIRPIYPGGYQDSC